MSKGDIVELFPDGKNKKLPDGAADAGPDEASMEIVPDTPDSGVSYELLDELYYSLDLRSDLCGDTETVEGLRQQLDYMRDAMTALNDSYTRLCRKVEDTGGIVRCQSEGIHVYVNTRWNVRHGFSSRMGGLSRGWCGANFSYSRDPQHPHWVDFNYHRFARAIGLDGLTAAAFTNQVHGNVVRIVTDADRHLPSDPPGPECDGIVSATPGLTLFCFTADCAPVLLYDPAARVAGSIHCGWRSTVQDILRNAVGAMVSLGAEPGRISASVGPAIGPCCFETGTDVPEAVEKLLGVKAAREYISKGARPGKFMVDLPGVVAERLIQLGVPRDRIDICRDCTKCNGEDYLWSERYSREHNTWRGSSAAAIQVPPAGADRDTGGSSLI